MNASARARASAATACNLEAVKLLLARKANVNAATAFGGEVKFGKIQLIHLMPLMLGSTFCSPAMVKTLLDAGAKVNETDVRGMSPLMFAVSSEEQNPAVVKLRELEEMLASAELYRDGDKVKETMKAFEETKAALRVLYEHWEEAVELN